MSTYCIIIIILVILFILVVIFLNFKVIIFAIWVLGALIALPMGIAHTYDQVAAIVVIIVTCCHIKMNLINSSRILNGHI